VVFLLESSELLRGSKLHASLDRAFAFTEQLGVDQQSPVRCGRCWTLDGSVEGWHPTHLGSG
jgi:hypothetical protein